MPNRSNEEKLLHITTNKSCNLNCIYCCEGIRKNGILFNDIILKRNVSLEERDEKVYNDLKKGRGKFGGVVFSSGEPTLNQHLGDYISYASEGGYSKIELVTNGIRIADRMYLQDLKKSGLSSLIISVNCFDERLSKVVSGNNYDGRKTLIGIRNALELSLDLTINVVINKQNLQILKQTLGILLKVGVRKVTLSFLRYSGFREYIYYKHNRVQKNQVRYSDCIDYFKQNDIGRLISKFERSYFNDFPYCVVNEIVGKGDDVKTSKDFISFDENTGKITVVPNVGIEREFVSECSDCIMKKNCSGLEKEYIEIFGEGDIAKEVYPII